MNSRSVDYNSYSNQGIGYSGGLGYSGGKGYNSDPIAFPTISPYSFPIQQTNPYSYHYESQPIQQPTKKIQRE